MSFDSSPFMIDYSANVLRNHETASAGIEILLFDLATLEGTHSRKQLFVSPEEITRSKRYKFDQLGRLYLWRRHILRALLANRLERHPPDILFEENASGRPELVGGGYFFNTSHSGPYYAVALSEQVQPGVDIELHQEGKSYEELIHIALSDLEISVSDGSDAGDFLQYWTCKEALLKAYGQGLQEDLRTISLTFAESGVEIQSLAAGMGSPGDWQATLLDPGIDGLYCACGWSPRNQRAEP